jgi:hypothetical protein
LSFTLSEAQLHQQLRAFADSVWFAPPDLTPQNLITRVQRLYLPMWLVDGEVEAIWQAEAGFDYQAVSHHDKYNDNQGGWSSQQVTETRIRWEPRLGRLKRTYQNRAAPSLEEEAQLRAQLGPYNREKAQPYQPQALAGTIVRLPNRSPDDAWPDVVPAFQAAAAEECRQAAQAAHIRQFRWTATYQNLNWTLLLLPAYITYYLNDEQVACPVLLHGQSGQLSGRRYGSMKRAKQTGLLIASGAVVLFGLSLLLALFSVLLPPLFLLAGIGLMAAFVIGALALLPILIVWQAKRTTLQEEVP